MIGRAAVRVLAACIAVVLWPVGVWDQLQSTRHSDPWATDQ